MVLSAVSFYHFPLLYWLRYLKEAPTKFGYSALFETVWQLLLNETSSLLTLTGSMLCIKLGNLSQKLNFKETFNYFIAVFIVEAGVYFQTGIFYPSLTGVQSILINHVGGLYWLYKICIIPPVLVFSFLFPFFAIKGKIGDPKILYSLTTIMFIPVTFNIVGWVLSTYVGTGGGLAVLGFSFFISWALIWFGGLLKPKYGIPIITLGAIINWFPYGVGFIMATLTYLLRKKQYNKSFIATLAIMLTSFSFAIYNILQLPKLT